MSINFSEPAAAQLGMTALRSLCALLERAPHFNYANNLLVLLVPLTNHRQKPVATLVCDTLGRVLEATSGQAGRGDRSALDGDCAVQLVRLLTRLVQKRRFRVRAEVLRIVLHLKIDSATAEALQPQDPSSTQRKRGRANQRASLSRNERKQQKEIAKLEKTLDSDNIIEARKAQIKMVCLPVIVK